jgi:hypothetical protein
MKKLFLLLVPAMMLFACNNVETTKDEPCCDKDKENCEETVCTDDVLTVDALFADIDANVDEEVSVCGKCTHICDHSGKKHLCKQFRR